MADKLLCLHFLAMAPLAELSLHLLGFRKTRKALRAFSRPKQEQVWKNQSFEARRRARLLHGVSRHSIFPSRCLARSLVLWANLRKASIPTVLRFGQRRGEEGKWEGHAWIELDNCPINETPEEVASYQTFSKDFSKLS